MEKDTLVIGGGGIRGFAMMGILHEMDKCVDLRKMKNIIGTSVGSILGYLICFMKPDEIFDKTKNMDILSESNIDVTKMFSEYGIIKFEILETFLMNMTKQYFEKESITFKELNKKTGKDLRITGTNISKKQGEIFSKKTTPDMNIIDAIKISTCIPYLFTKMVYNGDYYVDGSLTNGYPWKEFKVSNKRKIGIRAIMTDCDRNEYNIIEYMSDIISTIVNITDNTKECKIDTIEVSTKCNIVEEHDRKMIENLYNEGKIIGKEFMLRLSLDKQGRRMY